MIRNLNTHVSHGGELTLQDGVHSQAAVAISDNSVDIQGGAATGEVLTPDGVLHARLVARRRRAGRGAARAAADPCANRRSRPG